jgi:chromosome segregation ATPase
VNTEPDLMGELASLTARVEAATDDLSQLRQRAPELRQVVIGVDERLAQCTWDLARANAEAAGRAERLLHLRTRLGDLDDRLASFRDRVGRLPRQIDGS